MSEIFPSPAFKTSVSILSTLIRFDFSCAICSSLGRILEWSNSFWGVTSLDVILLSRIGRELSLQFHGRQQSYKLIFAVFEIATKNSKEREVDKNTNDTLQPTYYLCPMNVWVLESCSTIFRQFWIAFSRRISCFPLETLIYLDVSHYVEGKMWCDTFL